MRAAISPRLAGARVIHPESCPVCYTAPEHSPAGPGRLPDRRVGWRPVIPETPNSGAWPCFQPGYWNPDACPTRSQRLTNAGMLGCGQVIWHTGSQAQRTRKRRMSRKKTDPEISGAPNTSQAEVDQEIHYPEGTVFDFMDHPDPEGARFWPAGEGDPRRCACRGIDSFRLGGACSGSLIDAPVGTGRNRMESKFVTRFGPCGSPITPVRPDWQEHHLRGFGGPGPRELPRHGSPVSRSLGQRLAILVGVLLYLALVAWSVRRSVLGTGARRSAQSHFSRGWNPLPIRIPPRVKAGECGVPCPP